MPLFSIGALVRCGGRDYGPAEFGTPGSRISVVRRLKSWNGVVFTTD